LRLVPTPSQTAGPYVEIGMGWNADGRLVPAGTVGEICVTGIVLDGAGAPVTDAALEFWQADPAGRYDSCDTGVWTGFTRALTGNDGRYMLWTVKPGVSADPGGSTPEAPHVNVSIFARGLLQRLVTRFYFDDEPAANKADPVLGAIDEPAVSSRLVATSTEGGYRFDILLQGDEETPFFVP
jgi:protocatechuate 3,4-dioxygenase alpha subunit